MPRAARKKSSTGIYHVMRRGVNRQSVFLNDEDNEKFLQTLKECKIVSEFELYGYCLMGNHVHLLLKEEKKTLRLCLSASEQDMYSGTIGNIGDPDTYFKTDIIKADEPSLCLPLLGHIMQRRCS